jgi:TRAP-type mannitol/chloroaromatic compound transport system substrate-binding protein
MIKPSGIGLIVGLVMGTIMVPSSVFCNEPQVVWKMQTPFVPSPTWHKSGQIWAEEVFKMSGGRMKVELIGPVRGEVPHFDIAGLVEKGVRDAGHIRPIFLARKYPAAGLFAVVPGFFDLFGYVAWMNAYGGKELLQEVVGDSFKVFPVGMSWGKNFAWSNKKIEQINDFKGLKFGNAAGAWERVLKDAGAKNENLGWDAFHGFQEGSLDATEFLTPYDGMMVGFHKFSKFCYFPGLQAISMQTVLIVNPQKWNSLPDDLKEIVQGASNTALLKDLTHWAMLDMKAIHVLKEGGNVQILKLSREVQQEILDKMIPIFDSNPDLMFQKVWKSQKEFWRTYVPYLELQKIDVIPNIK